jgi:putative transcriptional regulator
MKRGLRGEGANAAGSELSMGAELLQGLQGFADALEAGIETERYTIRTVKADLAPQVYDAVRVRKTRELLGMSQAVFALFLGVSRGTVRQWEQGDRPPAPIACRMMDEIWAAPDHWRHRASVLLTVE